MSSAVQCRSCQLSVVRVSKSGAKGNRSSLTVRARGLLTYSEGTPEKIKEKNIVGLSQNVAPMAPTASSYRPR